MIPVGVAIYIALEPVDMRYSFDRLSGLAKEQVGSDARCGSLFIFHGRRRDKVQHGNFERVAHEKGLRAVVRRLRVGVGHVVQEATVPHAPPVFVAVLRSSGATRREQEVEAQIGHFAQVARLQVLERDVQPWIDGFDALLKAIADATKATKQRVAWFATPLFMSTKPSARVGEADT